MSINYINCNGKFIILFLLNFFFFFGGKGNTLCLYWWHWHIGRLSLNLSIMVFWHLLVEPTPLSQSLILNFSSLICILTRLWSRKGINYKYFLFIVSGLNILNIFLIRWMYWIYKRANSYIFFILLSIQIFLILFISFNKYNYIIIKNYDTIWI